MCINYYSFFKKVSALSALVFIFSFGAVLGERAPEFFISSLTKNRFETKKTDGPFVVSFFFVACKPCREEIPALYKLISTEFPQVPLLFIDPIKEDSVKQIKRFARKLKVPKEYFYKDGFGAVGNKFSMDKTGYPAIFGIENSEIIFSFKGLKEDTLSKIKNHLQ